MSDTRWLPWERLDDRSPLASRMAADTARAIIELRHPPGAFLTEADLAAAAEASRTPAREAMLQLEAWSLVRLLPKKGAVVTTVTPEERHDMLSFRALIEIDAVGSISRGSADVNELRAGLRASLDRQRAAIEAGDPLAFASADYAFHAAVIRSGGNSVVTGLLETLGPRVARLTYLAISESPHRMPLLMREHEELSRLAAAGDSEHYASLIHEHIAIGHFAPRSGS